MKEYTVRIDGDTVEILQDGRLCSVEEVDYVRRKVSGLNPISAYVYLIRKDNLYKVGMTYDLGRRLKEIGGELIDYLPCSTYRNARRIEGIIHKIFASCSVGREWFDLLPSHVEMFSGFTEEILEPTKGQWLFLMLDAFMATANFEWPMYSEDERDHIIKSLFDAAEAMRVI